MKPFTQEPNGAFLSREDFREILAPLYHDDAYIHNQHTVLLFSHLVELATQSHYPVSTLRLRLDLYCMGCHSPVATLEECSAVKFQWHGLNSHNLLIEAGSLISQLELFCNYVAYRREYEQANDLRHIASHIPLI